MAIRHYIKSRMIIYADDISFAEKYIAIPPERWTQLKSSGDTEILPLLNGTFGDSTLFKASTDSALMWQYISLVKSSSTSQYDIVNELVQKNIKLPGPILCVAGEGRNFHGFKNRPWVAPPGNIYLTAYFTPNCIIDNFGAGFMILAAISVIDTIDAVPELNHKAGIKWVNDVLINGAKVGGVLSYTQQEGDKVTGATLGIGLNVAAMPNVRPTPFVPRVATLADFCPDSKNRDLGLIFKNLINALDCNYRILEGGGYYELLERYRERSLVIGRKVEICSDTSTEDAEIITEGSVVGIGNNLELVLEGQAEPITRGRLIFKGEFGA